ncbi:hypothetical protein [Enterococcus sp. AZ196]|uniref:hypothetical protein n=1 Tax=Enterococcus sp. AZ196 TaxID=2774659 RepID=UPI003D2D65AF
MKRKSGMFPILLITIVALASITFWYFLVTKKENKKNEIMNREITEIVYGEVYTFSEEGNKSGYIKFIDGENYLAMPSTKSPEDSFGDGETYDIIFIEGKYSKNNEKFYLGKSVIDTRIFFEDEEGLKKNRYDEIYTITKPNLIDFETGSIEKKEKQWIYRRNSSNGYVEYPLVRSKKDIPNSTEEFLKKYKPVDKASSLSE